MNRAGLTFLACALASAAARPAHADPPQGPTLLGAQAAIAGGAVFGNPNGAVDHELAHAGWSHLPVFVPDAEIGFGLTFHDFSVDLHFGGIDAGFAGPRGSKATGELDRKAIGVDFGTRARLGHGIAIAPFVGIGTLQTTLCFDAPPSARSATASSPFSQVIKNPGQGTCLGATSPVVDVGLSIPWTAITWRESRRGGESFQALTLGPKLSYSFRIDGGRTWSAEPGADAPISLPKFSGPTAPIGGAYVGIEARYAFGVVRFPAAGR